MKLTNTLVFSVLSLFPFVAYAAPKTIPQNRDERREKREHVERAEVIARPSNYLYSWIGFGAGMGYLHSVSPNVSIGGNVSMQIPEDRYYTNSFTETTNETHEYNLKYSVSAMSALAQVAWLSSGDEGFLASGMAGFSRVSGDLSGKRESRMLGSLDPHESVSVSESASDFGMSAGVQLGYLWTFDSGFSMGLLGTLVASQAELPAFKGPATQVVHDPTAMQEVQTEANKYVSPATLGLVLGFAF